MGHIWKERGGSRLNFNALVPRVSWRDIFWWREPAEPKMRALRSVQINTFVRLVPITYMTQLIAATILLGCLWESVDSSKLLLWYGIAAPIVIARTIRALRLRRDRAYARQKPPTMANILLLVSLLACFWMIPPVLWFNQAGPQSQMFIAILYTTMLSAGSVTMVAVPSAAVVYIAFMMAACVAIGVHLGLYSHLLLLTAYGAVLMWAVMINARYFMQHIRIRHELEERGAIIELLREFGAVGSGGLWEVDQNFRFVAISEELAQAFGSTSDEVIGKTALSLIDPDGKARELASGVRTMLGHFEKQEEFHDVAIPALVTRRWWSLSGKPIFDDRMGVVGWRGVGSDITDLRLQGDDAVRMARRDMLTGLGSRLLVREQLEEVLLMTEPNRIAGCALLLVDLDRFKLVNDTLGHAVGDRLLIEVARRLERVIDGDGSVGRLGGDEFAVVWTGNRDRASLAKAATRIIDSLSGSFKIGAATVNIGATVGIAIGPEDGLREEQLLRAADLALYRVKQNGRGSFAFFEKEMFERAEDLRHLENDVRGALQSDALRLAYQPIVDSVSGKIVGREALLRWHHPTRGDIPPDRFIPIIEDAGLIHQIGAWVIHEACRAAAQWEDGARVAVNVSAAQLSGDGLAETVLHAIGKSGLAPERLEIEVTENVFLGDDLATLNSLEQLRLLGCRLVLDDFGKGYSSLGYLSRAKVSKIKIDQDFVRGAAEGQRESVSIIHAILALANGLGIATTAEGVESEDQATAMRYLGVRELQGFYFGRPELCRQATDAQEARRTGTVD